MATILQNAFNNIGDIAPEAMDVLQNNLTFSRTVSHKYSKAWESAGGRIGDTYNIRIPGYYGRVAGSAAVPTGYNDVPVPVTLKQYNSSIYFSDFQMRLNVDEMRKNVLEPLLEPLWEGMDADGIALYSGINQFAGTPGTAIVNQTPFLNGKATMAVQSAKPQGRDCNGLLNPFMEASMVGAFPGMFNPQSQLGEDIVKGEISGTYSGVKYFSTANLPTFTLGTWGTSNPVVAVTTGATDGGSSFNTTGWASGASTLNAGDCFTIAGVYAFNPANRQATGTLKQFTVLNKVSDTAGAITISVYPNMYLTGPNQNVTALPVSGSSVYMWSADGTAPILTSTGKVSPTSLLFYEDAFTLATADLESIDDLGGKSVRIKDKRTGINLRLSKWWDGMGGQQLIRADILYGWAMPRPGFACRIVS
jgi:hypothetical protein